MFDFNWTGVIGSVNKNPIPIFARLNMHFAEKSPVSDKQAEGRGKGYFPIRTWRTAVGVFHIYLHSNRRSYLENVSHIFYHSWTTIEK